MLGYFLFDASQAEPLPKRIPTVLFRAPPAVTRKMPIHFDTPSKLWLIENLHSVPVNDPVRMGILLDAELAAEAEQLAMQLGIKDDALINTGLVYRTLFEQAQAADAQVLIDDALQVNEYHELDIPTILEL